MKLMRSLLTDVLTVHAGDAHLAIAPGEVVDVDQVLCERVIETPDADADGGVRVTREPVTLSAALGAHGLASFELATAASTSEVTTAANTPAARKGARGSAAQEAPAAPQE